MTDTITVSDSAFAFEFLLEALNVRISEVNEAGASAFAEGNLDWAAEVLYEANRLDALRAQVLALREKWYEVLGLPEDTPDEEEEEIADGSISVADFRAACVARLEESFETALVKETATAYVSPDRSMAFICAVSKLYTHSSEPRYWFAFHSHQAEFLEAAPQGILALGCGSPDQMLALPIANVRVWLDSLNTTERDGGVYWHFHILQRGDRLVLDCKKGTPDVDVTDYVLW